MTLETILFNQHTLLGIRSIDLTRMPSLNPRKMYMTIGLVIEVDPNIYMYTLKIRSTSAYLKFAKYTGHKISQ